VIDLKKEISREPPFGTGLRNYKDGEPILYAFECAVLECYTGKRFTYTAVNLTTGKTEVLIHKASPLAPEDIEALVEKLRCSLVAGAGRFQADMPVRERISLHKAREILYVIFKKILPEYGFAILKEQISLAEQILSEISQRKAILAEAAVGTGKTLAYLVPAIIAKRGRINDFWNMGLYPEMQLPDMAKMPIVIATSSIALQRAILTEYIPELSQILLENGVIKEPLSAILRKGKEHYICERNLRAHLAFIGSTDDRQEIERLLPPSEMIDLAEVDVTPHTKRKICVFGRCVDTCQYHETCEYVKFRDRARSFEYDIQVCNHNYLLADALLRADGRKPLIPNYQSLIVDEAHKFMETARSMYGVELSSVTARDVLNTVDDLKFKREGLQKTTRRAAKKLYDENTKLFRSLIGEATTDDAEDESDRFTADLDNDTTRHLRNIRDISERLILTLRDEAFFTKAEELLVWVSRKYGVNIDRISLRDILAVTTGKNATRESQNEVMRSQVVSLHRAICYSPEIKRRTETEKSHKKEQHGGYSPEYQALRRNCSSVDETIWKKARRILPLENVAGRADDKLAWLLWELEQLQKQADAFIKHNDLICWLEAGRGEERLCAIPKDLCDRLYNDLWSKGIPTIFTSGTLSAGGDFSHIKQKLGLEQLGNRVAETSKPSPYNYNENAMLYISETMPFPDRRSTEYLDHMVCEIEMLVRASHGHAAVLFTSYKVMDLVWARLQKRELPFPMFRLDKGGVREIGRFKASNGGVLFASGALWEGIDIPGDALSMLIIVKLPFAVPDPIGEYEQTLYKDISEFKARVVVPEMLIKLKQGFGRLIRTETDTGVVAILDSRVNSGGAYRTRVVRALPDCRVTADIAEVERFFKAKKPLEYFKTQDSATFSQVGKRVV